MELYHVTFGLCVFFIFYTLWQWTKMSPGQMVDSQRRFIHAIHELISRDLWTLCFFIFYTLWQWTKVSPGQMVNSQRAFIHIVHGIMSRDFWTLCFFMYLWVVTMDESESRSNGRLPKGFHPHHTWDYVQGLCVFLISHALWQWTNVSPGQMVNSQRIFIHIMCGIISPDFWTLCFFIYCEARPNYSFLEKAG